jgi:hypothetical protein
MNLWPFRLLFQTPAQQVNREAVFDNVLELPYAQRPHNANLRKVLPDKAVEIQAADERSEKIYDQIDEHVGQLRQVRAALAQKKNGKS